MRDIIWIIYVVSTVLIILSNLVVVIVVASSPRLRVSRRYLLIGNLAVADLFMGSFVMPLFLRQSVEQWIPDCHLALALQVVGDHCFFFVTGWTLVTLNAVTLRRNAWFPCLQMRCSCTQSYPVIRNAVLLLWPWILGMVLLAPILANNVTVLSRRNGENPLCILSLPTDILVVVNFVNLYLPFYFVVASTVTIMTCSRKNRAANIESGRASLVENAQVTTVLPADTDEVVPPSEGIEDERESHSNPSYDNDTLICVPNLIYVLCYLPWIVTTWLHLGGVRFPLTIYLLILTPLLGRSYLLPLCWLVFRTWREEVVECGRRLKNGILSCFRHAPPASASSVSFSRLQATQTPNESA